MISVLKPTRFRNALFFLALIGCQKTTDPVGPEEDAEMKIWHTQWNMAKDFWEQDSVAINVRFDSLVACCLADTEVKFLRIGVNNKMLTGMGEEVPQILRKLSADQLQGVCVLPGMEVYAACEGYTAREEESVTDTGLQKRLVSMYVQDQAQRGNYKSDLVAKYRLDSTQFYVRGDGVQMDKDLNTELSAIIEEYGFPTVEMVGKEGMRGVFILTQHADHNPDWQRAQLPAVEVAAERGDLAWRDYAYLYDRVMVNAGEPQYYGTQCAVVDVETRTVVLKEVRDSLNLEKRRMEIGLMPTRLYKRLMLGDFVL